MRVVVDGPSMDPTLAVGDRLLVVALPPRAGRLVVHRDPRQPDRLLVKRVTSVDGAEVTVLGDNPAWSTDSRHFGPLPRHAVLGRPVYRYHPSDDAGWLWRA